MARKFQPGDRVFVRTGSTYHFNTGTVSEPLDRGGAAVVERYDGYYRDYWVRFGDGYSSWVNEEYLSPESAGAPEPEADNVNHPPHYKFSSGAEVIDISEQLSFNGGNAVKYVARATRQDGKVKGNVIEDLQKAQWYINREIERLSGEEQSDG